MCKIDLNTHMRGLRNISANVKSLETGDWYKDRIGPDKLGGGQWAKDRLGIGGQDAGQAWKRAGLKDFAKEGWGGGDWMDRVGMTENTLINKNWFSGNKGERALADLKSSLGEAGLGIPGAYEGGNWMKRFGMENPNFSKDWGGGNWQDRLGLGRGERASVDDMQGIVHELGLSQEAWATNLGGGNWYKKKLGMGQFDKKGGGGGDSEASGTDDTTTTTTTEEKVIEEKMNQLTEDDPQEAARIAATRARRRRALKNKFGKRQTIRTSGRGAKQYA